MIDMSNIAAKLQQMPQEIETATLAYAETVAADLQRIAQQNRPWKDRTGQARQRLRGYAEAYDTGVRIVLAHGVDYGEQLEYGHEKRYAIIEPTLRKNQQRVVSGWQRMVKQI